MIIGAYEGKCPFCRGIVYKIKIGSSIIYQCKCGMTTTNSLFGENAEQIYSLDI